MKESFQSSLFESGSTPLPALLKDDLADGEARYQAIDPQGSFIVQAPAGSGKTALLTQRFLALLSQVTAPEHIVAMTFTKKAAAEMRERILTALQKGLSTLPENTSVYEENTWRLAQAALQNDRHQGWQLLQNPNRLRVRTIDAMNGYLVQQMPLLSRLGTQPKMSDQPDTHYLKAARAALKSDESQQMVGSLLGLVNGNYARAENLLVSMLAKRDQWMNSVLALDDSDRKGLERAMSILVAQEQQQAVAQLESAVPLLQESLVFATFASKNGQTELLELVGVTLDVKTDLTLWQHLGNWLLTAKGEFRKTVTKAQGFPPGKGDAKTQKDQFLILLEDLRLKDFNGEISTALAQLAQLPQPYYEDSQWLNLTDLLHLLKLAVAHLKLSFQASGEADFIEVAQAASQSLGTESEPTPLAQQLDYSIKHLLIDEFQDTSVTQYELVKKLVAGWQSDDEHSLFIVGDPMQSIYRFREAEVGNFLQAWKGRLGEAGQVRLTPLNLSVNFRSSKSVVDWVNATFTDVFPKQNQIEKGAVTFTSAQAFSNDMSDGVFQHWQLNETVAQEGQAMLKVVSQRLPQLAQGESMGVLGRTRGHLIGLASLLKQKGIAFKAVELEGLKDRQEVQDCEALARALHHLGDRPAWIALLRSPLVGLSLKDMYALIAQQDETLKKPIWQLIYPSQKANKEAQNTPENYQAWYFLNTKLSEEGQQRLLFVAPLLASALNQVGSMPFAQLVKETWLALDGAQTVESATALQNVEAFWQMLQQLDESATGLTVQNLSQQLEKLYALPDASPESQQIELMTMHKSKGLEFDTVLLPGLGRKSRGDESKLVSWMSFRAQDGEEHLVIAPLNQKGKQAQSDPGLVALIKRYEEEKQTYELGRLLYVAATRAKRQLHLFGSVDYANAKAEKEIPIQPTENSLLTSLWPCVKQDFDALLEQQGIIESAVDDDDTEAFWPKVSRLNLERTHFPVPNWLAGIAASLEEKTPQSDIDALHAKEVDPTQIRPVQNTLLAKSVGNLVHAVMEQWVELDLSTWDANRLNAALPAYESWLRAAGLSESLLSIAMKRVQVCLHNALHHSKVRWALRNDYDDSAAEWALSSIDSQGQSNHIVDRSFVDETGVRWIVDYKTSYLPETASASERKAFLSEQVENYRPQLERYGQLIEQLEQRPQKWVLYFNYLDEWVELKV